MRYQLVNKTGAPYVLEHPFFVKIDGYKKRIKFVDRFSKSGVVKLGDGKFDKRKIIITKNVGGETDEDFYNQVDPLIEYIQDYNEPIYLEDTENGIKTKIEIEKVDIKDKQTLEKLVSDVVISAVMIDSTFEKNYTEITGTLSTGSNIQPENTSYLDAYPIIELETSTNNNDLSLTNFNTGEILRIGNSGFVAGVKLVIDSVEGKIYLDDGTSKQDISYSLDDNSGFIHLTKGINEIQYDSVNGDIDITIKYNERVIF